MNYIDNVNIKGQEYEIHDTNAREDIADLSSQLKNTKEFFGDMLLAEKTAGPESIITIDDAAGFYAKDVVINIEPAQNKRGGKNLLEVTAITSTIYNVKFTVNNDGTINISGTPTANIVNYVIGYVTLQAGNYKANGFDIGAAQENRIDLINNETMADIGGIYAGNTLTFSLSKETTIKVVLILLTSSGAVDTVAKPMIFRASETDATFAPYSNICPITGWDGVTVTATGANIWDEEWESGRYNTTTGEPESTTTMIRSKSTNYIPVSSNANYYFNNNGVVFYYDKDKVFLSSQTVSNTTFTTPNGAAYLRFRLSADYGTTYNNDVAINSPATVTAYESYKSRTASVDFGQTLYGGTVDLATGECVVDRAMVNLGTLNWNTDGVRFVANLPGVTLAATRLKGICSMYPVVDTSVANAPDKSFIFSNTSSAVYVKDSAYSDATSFTAAMNGVQLVYYLANPIILEPLTPAELELFKGANNISADAGQITVKYWEQKDLQSIIKETFQVTDEKLII